MTLILLTLALSLLMVATKALDCLSTARGLRTLPISAERNPVARWLMRRWGVRATITGVFVTSLAFVTAAAAVTITLDDPVGYAAFIGYGLVVSTVQALAARHNWHACRPHGRSSAATGGSWWVVATWHGARRERRHAGGTGAS